MTKDTPGVEPQAAGQAPAGGQEPEPESFSAEYVKELRNEAAKWRTSLRALESKVEGYGDVEQLRADAAEWQKVRDAQKSELEKLQERAQTLEQERDRAVKLANDRLLRAAIVSEASKIGFANPEDAFRLIDPSSLAIQDDGTVKGAAEAVKALEGRLPLARTPAPSLDGGAGGGQKGGKNPVYTEAEIREMAAVYNLSPQALAETLGVKLS